MDPPWLQKESAKPKTRILKICMSRTFLKQVSVRTEIGNYYREILAELKKKKIKKKTSKKKVFNRFFNSTKKVHCHLKIFIGILNFILI